MKKIILSVAAVFAFGFANAQDKKESAGGQTSSDLNVTMNQFRTLVGEIFQ
jgi:hypothetical protein